MIKSKYIAKIIFEMLETGKNPEVVAKLVRNFLHENNLVLQLPNIIYHLDLISKSKNQNKTILINSSHILNPGMIKLLKQLTKAENKVAVESKLCPELIGGFIVKYKGYIYDGSIKNQINQLRKVLNSEI